MQKRGHHALLLGQGKTALGPFSDVYLRKMNGTFVPKDPFALPGKLCNVEVVVSRRPGNFPGRLETVQIIWKLSRSPGNFLAHLETWKLSSR